MTVTSLYTTVYFSELCFIDLDQISCDISAVPNASFLQKFEKTDLGTDLINSQRIARVFSCIFGLILVPGNVTHAGSVNESH